jgi:uncharacterized membrane protein
MLSMVGPAVRRMLWAFLASATLASVPAAALSGVGTPLQSLPFLPEGFALPPLAYLVPVLAGTVAVAALLISLGPPVTDWTAIALTPWMACGSVAYVLFQQSAVSPAVRPFFGNPTVYLTTAVVAGTVWVGSYFLAAARGPDASVDRQLGAVGTGVFLVLVAASLWVGAGRGGLEPLWPTVGVVGAVVLSTLTWVGLGVFSTEAAVTTGRTGAIVVFGHVLDGVSTALGVDLLGAGERTPLSAAILDFSAGLPTADFIGAGWLFVLVKLVLAALIVVAFEEFVDDDPRGGRLTLAFVAAVGLGPGVHNVVLFTVSESLVAA